MAADPTTRPPLKLTTQQVRRVGEHFVAGELHRRGAHAVSVSEDKPATEVRASDATRTRTVSLHVKTKTAGTWQTTIRRGRAREEDIHETEFWVFVDIGRDPATHPSYFVVPAWWMENSIHVEHEKYLGERGGQRARTPESTHHAVPVSRIEEWRDRWDLLGILAG